MSELRELQQLREENTILKRLVGRSVARSGRKINRSALSWNWRPESNRELVTYEYQTGHLRCAMTPSYRVSLNTADSVLSSFLNPRVLFGVLRAGVLNSRSRASRFPGERGQFEDSLGAVDDETCNTH